MRTASTPRPNQVLVLPTKEVLLAVLDEMTLTNYSGKKCVSHTEIKHIHLNYTIWDLSNQNN